MDAIFTGIMLLIAAAFAIGATVLAVVALFRGEGVGKTFKTWIRRVIDALTGVS
jgi:hypothetical protein